MAKPDLKPIAPPTNGNGNGHAPPGMHEPYDADVPTAPAREGGVLHPDARQAVTPVERHKVIKFSHVSKRFQLHTARPKSFQDMLVGLMGRARLARPPAELAPSREFWALKDVNFSIY